MKRQFITEIKNILLVTFGSATLAFGVTFFLLPAKIATGGTPGMSLVLHYMTNVSVALAMIMINVPLIIAGIKFIDFPFALRTIYSIMLTSILLSIYPNIIESPQAMSSLLLPTLYGGVCIGLGVGFILKGQASAGGTTIIAKIVSNYSPLKPAQAILLFDMVIIIAIAIIFEDVELALWSLLSIYITAKVIDKVLSGGISEKIVHIVSDNITAIGQSISEELGRDGTMLTGENLTNYKNKKVLLVVVGSREVQQLKNIITKLDERAIVIIMEASEIMGSSLLNK